jgi:ATP-dependent Clp protease ATP-binding subunit ClpA
LSSKEIVSCFFLLQGKLDPVVGRQDQIERVTQILGRRTKNNPCLIGEPGVGKTAIAEGLAQRICNGDVPETIEGKKVSLDCSVIRVYCSFLYMLASG